MICRVHHIYHSLSRRDYPAWCKCTISEHIIENSDPLVICKKACEVTKHGASTSATSEAVPTVEALNSKAVAATKKKTQVLLAFEQISTHLIVNTIIYPQPTIEVSEDEDSLQPYKAIPKKGSHILELANGSEDNDDDDMPIRRKGLVYLCLHCHLCKTYL